jgi:hypothetical protein
LELFFDLRATNAGAAFLPSNERFFMHHLHHRFVFVSLFSFCSLAAACSAEVTSTPSPAPSSVPSANEPAPGSSASPGTSPSSPQKDGGADTGAATAGPAKLPINSATYFITQAGATTSAFGVEIELENDGSVDVTSIEEMSFDFGGGKKVALNQPACKGSFPIAAGATKTIEVRMVVSASGQVSPAGFSMMCPSSQSFGAGDGTAPTDASFSSPIAIVIEGKTKSGTFTASAVATHE